MYLCRTRIDNIKKLSCLFIFIYNIIVILIKAGAFFAPAESKDLRLLFAGDPRAQCRAPSCAFFAKDGKPQKSQLQVFLLSPRTDAACQAKNNRRSFGSLRFALVAQDDSGVFIGIFDD